MNDSDTPAKVASNDWLGRAVAEAGPWEAGIALTGHNAGRAYVESCDFTHDVRLYVDGDFEDAAQKLAYAREIARRLTAWKPEAA